MDSVVYAGLKWGITWGTADSLSGIIECGTSRYFSKNGKLVLKWSDYLRGGGIHPKIILKLP